PSGSPRRPGARPSRAWLPHVRCPALRPRLVPARSSPGGGACRARGEARCARASCGRAHACPRRRAAPPPTFPAQRPPTPLRSPRSARRPSRRSRPGSWCSRCPSCFLPLRVAKTTPVAGACVHEGRSRNAASRRVGGDLVGATKMVALLAETGSDLAVFVQPVTGALELFHACSAPPAVPSVQLVAVQRPTGVIGADDRHGGALAVRVQRHKVA